MKESEFVLINSVTGIYLVVSVFIKGYFTYLHIKKTQGVQPQGVFKYGDINQYQQANDYLRPTLIIDQHKSIYKTVANTVVIIAYLSCIAFFIINAKSLAEFWESLKRVP